MLSDWWTIYGFFEDSFYVGFKVDGAAHCTACGFQRYGNCVRALYERATSRLELVEYTDTETTCVLCHQKLYNAPLPVGWR